MSSPVPARVSLNTPNRSTRIGCRDRAILALLIGCGLRRTELISLDVESIQLRDSRWVLPDLIAKGNRVRTVPVPVWVKMILDEWLDRAGIANGAVFRPLNKGGRLSRRPHQRGTVWKVVLQIRKREIAYLPGSLFASGSGPDPAQMRTAK